jgi:alcohol dehydrogenase
MTTSLFRFYNPVKIISGEQALDSLGYELKQLGAERPLIITDQGVAAAGLIGFVREALGHALGGVCQVPHGIAMNIFLPYGLEYNLPAVGEIIGELLLPLAGPERYLEAPAGDRPQKTIASLREMQDELYKTTKLARTLSEAGVPKDACDEIAQKAVKDPALALNPLPVSYEDAFDILNKAL